MKTGSGGCLVSALLLTVPLATGGIWEALQRHRFNAQVDRIDAALEAFRAKAVALGRDGKPLYTASGRSGLPYVVIGRTGDDSWDRKERYWTLGADFVDARGRWLPFKIEVVLTQGRQVLLRSPELSVVRQDLHKSPVPMSLDEALAESTIRASDR